VDNSRNHSFTCLICGTSVFERVLKNMLGVYAGNSEYEILKCKTCKLLTTYPRPSQSQLQSIYSNDYAYSYHASVSREKHARAKKLLGRVDRFVGLTSKVNFLELGCANGELSRILSKRYGLSGIGVDLNIPEQQNGEGVLFLRQSINQYLETATEFFDVVILSHTLEHLLNPLFTLELIRKRLKADGYIIIVVPNALSTRTKAWGYWQVPVHISHFDESSLKTLLLRSGFAPIHIANASLDFLGMGLTILNLFKTKKSPKQSKTLTLLIPFFALCWSTFYKLGNSDLILIAGNSDVPGHSKSEG